MALIPMVFMFIVTITALVILIYQNLFTGRTFITQKDIIDRFEINEYCLVKTFEKIDNSVLESFCDYGKKLTKDLVKPHSEHRSSVITLVIISDNLLKENTLKLLGKFKYTKYYKFYFHGFSQVKVVLVDLFNNRVYCSKNAKLLKKYIVRKKSGC